MKHRKGDIILVDKNATYQCSGLVDVPCPYQSMVVTFSIARTMKKHADPKLCCSIVQAAGMVVSSQHGRNLLLYAFEHGPGEQFTVLCGAVQTMEHLTNHNTGNVC